MSEAAMYIINQVNDVKREVEFKKRADDENFTSDGMVHTCG